MFEAWLEVCACLHADAAEVQLRVCIRHRDKLLEVRIGSSQAHVQRVQPQRGGLHTQQAVAREQHALPRAESLQLRKACWGLHSCGRRC